MRDGTRFSWCQKMLTMSIQVKAQNLFSNKIIGHIRKIVAKQSTRRNYKGISQKKTN